MILSKSDYTTYLKHPAWLWIKKHTKTILFQNNIKLTISALTIVIPDIGSCTSKEANFASELGISIEAAAVITKKMKQYFAKGNLKNPLSGVSKYLRGEVTYGGSTINPKRRVNL